jgi:iron complex transport system ATP-binding protein
VNEEGLAADGGVVPNGRDGATPDSSDSSDSSDSPGPSAAKGSDASELLGEDLLVTYPSAAEPVIDGESIAIPAGQVTALVGPNGSGKSTLLKALSNQPDAEGGVVALGGRDIRDLGAKELARKLGLLAQENDAPASLTVSDLVAHGRYPHRGFLDPLTDADRAAIDRALSLAGVEDLRDREMGSLSGGQKQLAWIAMALAQETDVLLLNEPTTFLDLHHQLEVIDIVETLRDESEITVVLVLHEVEQAARYADHVIALDDGAVYARGTAAAVVTEGTLAAVFGVEATVERTERGPRITPLRAIHADKDGDEADGIDENGDDEGGTDGSDTGRSDTDGNRDTEANGTSPGDDGTPNTAASPNRSR